MSHLAYIKTKIKDLEVLKKCLIKMGYNIKERRQKFSLYGGQSTVGLIANKPQGLDIGFRKGTGGNWEAVFERFGGTGVSEKEFRENLERNFLEIQNEVKRRYALEKVSKGIQKMGFAVVEQNKSEDNTIRLLVRRWR